MRLIRRGIVLADGENRDRGLGFGGSLWIRWIVVSVSWLSTLSGSRFRSGKMMRFTVPEAWIFSYLREIIK